MPYSLGTAIFAAALLVVFGTFAYLLVNARSLMALFRRISDGEIRAGPGSRHGSKRGAAIALILHFAAWGIAGLAGLYLLADHAGFFERSRVRRRSAGVGQEVQPGQAGNAPGSEMEDERNRRAAL